MKRKVYILMFMAVLLFTGCNLFKGLDKENLSSPEAFEFKLDDAMANGDYTVVVDMIDSKIANNPALKAVDDAIGDKFTAIDALTSASTTTDIALALEAIADSLDNQFTNATTKNDVIEYIELKVTQAEALTGEAGLKMTDIIAELTASTSSNKTASIGSFANIAMSAGNSRLSLGDVVPESLILEKIEQAKNAYGSALPVNEGEVHKFLMGKGKDTYCLNMSLINIVSFARNFIVTFSTNGKSDGLVAVDGADFSAKMASWNSKLGARRTELRQIKIHLEHYADRNPTNGLIKPADIVKLNENIDEISALLQIDDFAEYNTFKTKAGL